MTHGGNLFHTCRHLNIASPVVLPPAQVLLNVNECMTWLEGLKKDAPKLQNAHLRKCLSLAQVREDTVLVIAIQKILRVESTVTWLTVPHPAGDTLYARGQQQLKCGTK